MHKERALLFRQELDNFVACNRELRSLELTENEWEAITHVANWLEAFRSATTQMSATNHSMLSTTFAIFRGLQEHLQKILDELPDTIDQRVKDGLLRAHTKLSDYYYRFDQTPFYTWAACNYSFRQSPASSLIVFFDFGSVGLS